MSFSNNFGAYFIIHSASLNPERANIFSAELNRVGISAFEVVPPLRIENSDPRLTAYDARGPKLVSLIDCFERTVKLAESRSLKSIVIFEDDIRFRPNFASLWGEVEPNVLSTQWEILVLHRTQSADGGAVVENRRKTTELVKIRHNTLTHCVIIRENAYAKFRYSLEYCVKMGYPADFFYGVFTHEDRGTIYATTKNLAGQASGLTSGLQGGRIRKSWFHSEFGCYRNKLEWAIVTFIRGMRDKASRLRPP